MSENPQLPGETLAQRLERGPIEPGSALAILEQLLGQLEPVHSRGAIHGHITPEVVNLADDGNAILSGFEMGLDSAEQPTVVGDRITDHPAYMAPEQLNGDFADARADVFALGVIAYEMLTGSNPFLTGEDEPRGTVAYRIVYRPYPQIARGAVPGLSEEARLVLSTAMAKDAATRFADARSFREALAWAGLAASSPVAVAAPASMAPAVAAAAVPEEDSFADALAAWLFEVRRNSAPYVVAASIVIVALAVVLVVIFFRPPATAVTETTAVAASAATTLPAALVTESTSSTAASTTAAPSTTASVSTTLAPSTTTTIPGKITGTVALAGLTYVYDGAAHAASVTTSPQGLKVTIVYSRSGKPVEAPTDAGSYDVTVTIDDGHYEGSVTGTLQIAKADATIKVNGWKGTYTGTAHGASASAVGVKGENLGTLLTVTGSFVNVPGGAVNWTFKGNANYNSASGSVPITITKAYASINANGWRGTYTGTAHAAGVSATGVRGENLGTLVSVSGSFTNVPGGTSYWTFKGNGNYHSASGSAGVVISKANASISVSGYSKAYDGKAHGATLNYVRGVRGESLSTLMSMGGQTYIYPPGGPARWTFAGNANYSSASGSVTIAIAKANASIHVSGWSGEYDGYAHGASGSASGVLGENLSGLLNLGASFSSVGTHTATWSFAGNSNYKSDSGSVSIVITEPPTTTTTGAAASSWLWSPAR